MKLAREPIAGVAATEVAATVAVTAVVVVMVVVAAAVEAVIVTAIVVAAAAATTANHAGNKQGKRKKLKGKSAVGTESINLYDCLFLLNGRCAVLPSFAFLLSSFRPDLQRNPQPTTHQLNFVFFARLQFTERVCVVVNVLHVAAG